MFELFKTWQKQTDLLRQRKITQDEYDEWRYNYPSEDTSKHWSKVPSKIPIEAHTKKQKKSK